MKTSDMIRELYGRMNISFAEFCRWIGQIPRNVNLCFGKSLLKLLQR